MSLDSEIDIQRNEANVTLTIIVFVPLVVFGFALAGHGMHWFNLALLAFIVCSVVSRRVWNFIPQANIFIRLMMWAVTPLWLIVALSHAIFQGLPTLSWVIPGILYASLTIVAMLQCRPLTKH